MDQHTEVLGLSETEIDLLIGAELLRDTLGVEAPTDAEKISEAQGWFESVRDEVANLICPQPAIYRYLHNEKVADRELLDAIVGALGALAGLPIPLSLLASKSIRFGLERLCSAS